MYLDMLIYVMYVKYLYKGYIHIEVHVYILIHAHISVYTYVYTRTYIHSYISLSSIHTNTIQRTGTSWFFNGGFQKFFTTC